MKESNTAERLRRLMSDRNLKQVDILRLCEPICSQYNIKMNKNDLSQYVNGKVEPGQFKLTVLAKALHVTEAWLMGFDVPMTESVFSEHMLAFSEEALDIARLYDQLDAGDQGEVRGTIKTMLRADKYITRKESVS